MTLSNSFYFTKVFVRLFNKNKCMLINVHAEKEQNQKFTASRDLILIHQLSQHKNISLFKNDRYLTPHSRFSLQRKEIEEFILIRAAKVKKKAQIINNTKNTKHKQVSIIY